jgi:glycogen synthase
MEAEAHLLTEHGHDVMKYERTNAEIYEDGTFADKIRALRDVAWSEKSYREIKNVIQNFRPDIMHVHNYWLILTPSILAAAKDCNVATVLTLHNYRLIRPGNQMLCNGSICEACIHGSPWRVLLHRCFPGKSFLKSLSVFSAYSANKKKNLFLNDWGDAYIALSAFGTI